MTETEEQIEFLRREAKRTGKPLCLETVHWLATKRRAEMNGGKFIKVNPDGTTEFKWKEKP